MDPISLAGLAIAVFDQLWKVGEHTAALVSAYQDFDQVRTTTMPQFLQSITCAQDSKAIENKIKDEINRTKALRTLLFQPCQVVS
jgi:hypothetical protein